MSDMTRVELASLAAAKQKLRKLTGEAERSGDPNMVHSAYKVGEFLGTALPQAWDAAEEKAPDCLPHYTGRDEG